LQSAKLANCTGSPLVKVVLHLIIHVTLKIQQIHANVLPCSASELISYLHRAV